MVISTAIKSIPLQFRTDPTIFSPAHIDAGTLAMLSCVDFAPSDRVLDLGCGYGVVGITAAKIIGPDNVVMSDVDPCAVELARENAALNGVVGIKILLSDGFNEIGDTDFTLILSNPPYQSDFSVAKRFIEKGFNRLVLGGRMYMVTKRRDWYRNKLIAVFGGVQVTEIDGYSVFCAQRRSKNYARRV